MFVSVLGPVRIVDAGTGRTIRSVRRRHLLAALTASVGDTVGTARLSEALWADDPPASAAAALQVHVSDLRSLLDPDRPARQDGGHITTEAEGYRLDLRTGQLDWTRATALAEAGRVLRAGGRHGDAHVVLGAALRSWPGPAYADAREAVTAHAQWLDDTRLSIEEDLLACALASGDVEPVAVDAARMVDEQPFRERRAALLILAHYRAGHQREALEAFEAVRHRLRDEIGCEPGPELQALHRAVLDHDEALASLALAPSAAEVAGPATVGEDRLRLRGDGAGLVMAEAVLWGTGRVVDRAVGAWVVEGHLEAMVLALEDEQEHPETPAVEVSWADGGRPVRRRRAEPSGLLGRDAEVTAVRSALDRGVLVSVVGPPGVGTSSVAAAAVTDRSTHAVPVAPGDGVDDLLGALADAAGVSRSTRTDQRLLAAVEGTVVLFDGADTAAEAVNAAIDRLGDHPAAVLTTGRSRLGRTAEAVVEVRPLPEEAAAALLAERAGRPRSELGPPESVAALLERLGGVPLAVELIAPAVRSLGAEAVVERLDRGPGLWSFAPSEGPDLGATIGWSHARLPADAARLLARSAVFAGRFTLDDLEMALGDDLLPADRVAPALAALAEASLVAPRRDVDGLTYELSAVVRAFAQEQLEASGEEPEVRRRHAHHIARSLAESGRASARVGVAAARRRVERSRRDLDLAVEWLERSGTPDDHLALADALGTFWFSTGRLSEGRAFTRRALGRGGHDRPRARCLLTAGFLAWFQADYAEVAACLDEASGLTTGTRPGARRLALEAALALVTGDLDRADEASRAALDAPPSGRGPSTLAVAATMAGTVSWYRARYAEAVARFRQAAEIGVREGLPLLTALARRGQALNLASTGQLDEGRAVAALAREDGERLGDPVNLGQGVAFAGLVELAAGEDDLAEALLVEAVAVSAPALELFGLYLETSGLLTLAGRRCDHVRVLELDGWIDGTVEGMGMPLPPTHRAERQAAVAAAEAALAPDAAAAARHRGRSLRPQDLGALVLR